MVETPALVVETPVIQALLRTDLDDDTDCLYLKNMVSYTCKKLYILTGFGRYID